MNNLQQPQPHQPLKLAIVEDEPVFRLGLVASLSRFADLQAVLEVDSAQALLRSLSALPNPVAETPTSTDTPDLILLNLELGQATGQKAGLALCQQLGARYPTLPVLLMSSTPEPLELAIALQAGAKGFWRKGASIEELVAAIRQVAAGEMYWSEGMQSIVQALTTQASLPANPTVANVPALITNNQSESQLSNNQTVLTVLRRNLRQSGLRQIEAAIAQINDQLQYPELNLLDQVFLTGRRRELRAARWFVNRLLAPSSTEVPLASPSPSPPPSPSPLPPTPHSPLPTPHLQPQTDLSQLDRSLQAALFDAVASKVQFNLHNLTDTPLEIDILKDEKKRELLYIILRKFEDILNDLRFSQVQLEQLADKKAAIVQDLWQVTTTDFFGRYYTLKIDNYRIDSLQQYQVELVEVLLQDIEIVQTEILDKIPLVQALLAHLLFQVPLTIDDTTYTTGTVEAMFRAELILQNLTIQVANAVMQPLLNRFGDVFTIKQNFYDKRLLSSREIERFRNNLSWRYRVERYINEPTAIFESRFHLWTIRESGITKTSIYAPRNEELAQLSGIQFAVTLALEARDAIAPRLRSAISFLGSGVVYVLTEVIGRGIGLIGRGVIKGVGNALQDTKLSRNSGQR